GRGLVDEAKDFESGDSTGIARGLTLGIVEIGRYGDYGFGDRSAERRFCIAFELLQYEGRDFRRSENLLTQRDLDYGFAAFGDAEGEEPEFVLYVGQTSPH